jgi:type I restriction enzyme M protein
MSLFESIRRNIIEQGGRIRKDKLFDALRDKYAIETINTFLDKNSDYFSIQGDFIFMPDYKITLFMDRLSDFIYKERISDPQQFKYIAEVCSIASNQKEIGRIQEGFFGMSRDENYRHFIHDIFSMISPNEWSDSEFTYKLTSRLFEFLISKILISNTLFSTPDTLIKLILSLIPQKESLKVYNPAAGQLKLLTALQIFTNSRIDAYTSEINPDIFELSILFARSNNFSGHFKNQDSLEDWWRSQKYDLVLSNPPFNYQPDGWEFAAHKYKDVGLNIISNSLACLNDDGLGIFLVPDTVLFGSTNDFRMFRRELVEEHSLSKIISLPVKLFAPVSALKTSLLLFDKSKLSDSVLFFDSSDTRYYTVKKDRSIELDTEKIISGINNGQLQDEKQRFLNENIEGNDLVFVNYEQIRKNNFSLQLNSYQSKFHENLGPDSVPLKKIFKINKRQSAGGMNLPYIRISELNSDIIDDPSKFGVNETRTQGKFLDSPAILIGNVGGSHKPSYFDGSFAAEVSTNITIFDFDKDEVFIPYIVQELNSDYVKKQMETRSVGATTLKHLRRQDLLMVQIKLPPFEEQKKIYNTRNDFVTQQSITLTDGKVAITDEEIFGTIKHEIGNILRGPDGFFDLLPDFLTENQISLTKPIVNIEGAESVGEMIKLSQSNINQVNAVLENMKGILSSDQKYFNPERQELRSFFKKRLNHEIKNGEVECYAGVNDEFSKSKNIYAEIDTTQFEYIIRNVVTNAIKHGKQEETLKFIVNIKSVEDLIEIHFLNDGLPFPADFSKDEYIGFGKKHGGSTGSGLGGYLISRIVNNHHGTLDILPGGVSVKIPEADKLISVQTNVDILITIPKRQ